MGEQMRVARCGVSGQLVPSYGTYRHTYHVHSLACVPCGELNDAQKFKGNVMDGLHLLTRSAFDTTRGML